MTLSRYYNWLSWFQRVTSWVGQGGGYQSLTVHRLLKSSDPAIASAPGHGIENTRERLRALYGDRASLEVARGLVGGTTGTIATLRVPYHEMVLESDRDAR